MGSRNLSALLYICWERQQPYTMKKKLLICFFSIGLFACEKDDVTGEPSVDYLPLTIGNCWVFELSGKDSVVNTHRFSGKDYFEIVNNVGNSTYYRKYRDQIFVKHAPGDEEELIFNLRADENDTWNYGAGKVRLITRNATITIGENQIDSCLQFSFFNESLIDYQHEVWLAPNIGFVQQNCQECFGSATNTMKLIRAKIGETLIAF